MNYLSKNIPIHWVWVHCYHMSWRKLFYTFFKPTRTKNWHYEWIGGQFSQWVFEQSTAGIYKGSSSLIVILLLQPIIFIFVVNVSKISNYKWNPFNTNPGIVPVAIFFEIFFLIAYKTLITAFITALVLTPSLFGTTSEFSTLIFTVLWKIQLLEAFLVSYFYQGEIYKKYIRGAHNFYKNWSCQKDEQGCSR